MKNQSEKGFSAIELVLVLLVLSLIGVAGWHAYQLHQQATGAPASGPKAAKVNTWTAKGTDYKFSDAKNWSLGTPKNGQDLTINTDTVATDSADGKLDDDMPGLSIGRLTITGAKSAVTGLALTISGHPLTVTGGISDQISAENAGVLLNNDLTFSGRQAVSVPAHSQLTFNGTKLDVRSSMVTFNAGNNTQANGITVNAPFVGKGTLAFVGQNTLLSGPNGDLASPDFTGTVDIKAGGLVSMLGSKALGTAAIQVENGGTLALAGTGTVNETLSNALTLAGNGVSVSGHGGGTGATLGALSACLTSAQQGCMSSTVSLTGNTKLTANTQLGQQPDGETFTNTYKFAHLDAASYTLTAVPGSRVQISR